MGAWDDDRSFAFRQRHRRSFSITLYLIQQCAALVGNGTGGGICTCPTEWVVQ